MRTLAALMRGTTLCAPQVGVWTPAVRGGDAVDGGRTLGTLNVLGRRITVTAPVGSSGEVVGASRRGPVGYGEVLVEVGERTAGSELQGAGTGTGTGTGPAGGHAVRSPIDGIFYRRSSPDEPAFVNVGDTVAVGQTLGLVEVMKTFNPVRAEAAGTVTAIEAGDQQEVAVGSVLLTIG